MYKELTYETLTRKIVYPYKEDVFFTTLRQRINDYFKITGLKKQDDPNMYMKTIVLLSMWAGFYICMIANYFHGWLLLMFQLAFHFSMFLMSVGMHMDKRRT